MKNISFVTNIAAPYRLLQLSELQRELGGRAVINTYFTQGMTNDRKWSLQTSSNLFYLKKILTLGKYGSLNFGLLDIVRKSDVVIIGGYEQPSYIILTLICRLLSVPYIILYDGIAPNLIKNHKASYLTKLKQKIVANATAYLVNGKVSKNYFVDVLRVDSTKIYNQYLSVNLQGSLSLKDVFEKNVEWRDKYNIIGYDKVVLYSGRLIETKNVELIIQATSLLNNCVLFIAGDGIQLEYLKVLADKIQCRVIFLGHLNETDLSAVYSAADCLVLPTVGEPWGLVVNEALCHSTPVVVSSNIGCHFDQVIDGVNGVVISELNAVNLSAAITSALQISKSQVFNSSIDILNDWNLTNSAKNIVRMLENESLIDTPASS
jgi:glycosyltransferase involved in cell wall biosynthesis